MFMAASQTPGGGRTEWAGIDGGRADVPLVSAGSIKISDAVPPWRCIVDVDSTNSPSNTGLYAPPPPRAVNRTVTYQEPCHLAHAQRISKQPRDLLRAIPGLTLEEMKESSLCCGSAGIYNIIREEMANELGDRKALHAMETTATEVISANPGCQMQVRASLRRNGSLQRVRHIAEILDEAYGGAKTKRAIIGNRAG